MKKRKIENNQKEIKIGDFELNLLKLLNKNASRVGYSFFGDPIDQKKFLLKNREKTKKIITRLRVKDLKTFHSRNIKDEKMLKGGYVESIVSLLFGETPACKQREIEEENMKELMNSTTFQKNDCDSFVQMCGVVIPFDITNHIFNYCEKTKDFLFGIGSANSTLYLLALRSWRFLHVRAPEILHHISLLVLDSCSHITCDYISSPIHIRYLLSKLNLERNLRNFEFSHENLWILFTILAKENILFHSVEELSLFGSIDLKRIGYQKHERFPLHYYFPNLKSFSNSGNSLCFVSEEMTKLRTLSLNVHSLTFLNDSIGKKMIQHQLETINLSPTLFYLSADDDEEVEKAHILVFNTLFNLFDSSFSKIKELRIKYEPHNFHKHTFTQFK